MDFNRKRFISTRAYEPFLLEARYNLITTMAVSLFIIVIFSVFSITKKIDVSIIIFQVLIFYFCLELTFVYRVSILVLFERKKCIWNEERVFIKKIVAYQTLFDPKNGESVITKLSPKGKNYDRYKVVCRTDNGKRLVFKTVMSKKKQRVICDALDENEKLECVIYYGKYTKIVMRYKGDNPCFDKLNYML